jgi:hypothetical protein
MVANLKTKSVKTPNNNHKIQEQRNHLDMQSSKDVSVYLEISGSRPLRLCWQ